MPEMSVDLREFDLTPGAEEVISAALIDIELLHRNKAYHNLFHTISVMRWANSLAGYHRLDDQERSLVVTAAAYHDYIHGFGQGEDEAASASQARENMEASRKFSASEIVKVADMIGGTVIEHTAEGKLVQRASKTGLLGARILADADLSGLGSPFPTLVTSTQTLMRERHPQASLRGPEMFKLLGVTIQLLEQEPLTEAAQVMLPHRRANLGLAHTLRVAIGREIGLLPAEDAESNNIDHD